jgi:hypothetical protein
LRAEELGVETVTALVGSALAVLVASLGAEEISLEAWHRMRASRALDVGGF